MLRSMGLSHNVDSVDELMQDMAESHDDVRLIQTGLATGVGVEPEGEDLEAEFALLMAGEDGDEDGGADGGAERVAPAVANTMASMTPRPVVPARQPAAEAALTLSPTLAPAPTHVAPRFAESALEV